MGVGWKNGEGGRGNLWFSDGLTEYKTKNALTVNTGASITIKVTVDLNEGGSSNGRYMGIYHVAIYVGNGMAVEALNEKYGVVYQKLRTNNACMVCRPNF